jgi:Flp pilus assembly protein TadG
MPGGPQMRSVGAVESQRGALAAMLAVLAVALLAMVGLVVDGGRAVAARRTAMDDAGQAARAGADALSVSSLRSGTLAIDPFEAVAAASRFLTEEGVVGTVEVSGETVTVHVVSSEPSAVLGIVGIRTIRVSASASATDVHGVTEGD